MTLLENVNQEIIVGVAIVIGSIFTAISLLVKNVYPVIRKLNQMVDDWSGTEERKGVPARPGVLERLAVIEEASKSADYNSKPNGGHSAYDKLNRKVDVVISDLEESKNDRRRLWLELNTLKRKEK